MGRELHLRRCASLLVLKLKIVTLGPQISHHGPSPPLLFDEMFGVNADIIRESAPPSLRSITITFMHHGVWNADFVAKLEALPSWAALDSAISEIRALKTLTCIVDTDGKSDLNAHIKKSNRNVGRMPAYRIADDLAAAGDNRYASVVWKMLPRMRESGKLRILEIVE